MAAIPGWEPFLGEDRALTLTVEGAGDGEGEVAAVVSTVADALSSAGFKVKDRRDDGFEASWLDKWELMPPDMEFKRTRLGVSATGGPGAVTVVVRVLAGEMHRRGSARAGKGLTAAYEALEDQGRRVGASDWAPTG